jgi:hypothetical protein
MKNEIEKMLADDTMEYGLRVEAEPVSIGDILPDSRVWVDGEPTDETLRGVSTIGITADTVERSIDMLSGYLGDYIVLVQGVYASWGEDAGERIIEQGEVIACFKK